MFPGGRFDYTHDAWGRLTSVTIYYTAMLQEPRGSYEYNGLNWRTVVLRDAPPNFQGMETQKRTLCYDQRWRLLEERIDDDANAIPGDGDDRLAQMVWGERYIDDAVLRRESNNLGNDGSGTTWEDEWNYVTDAMFSVVAVIDASTAALVERTRYTPYGVARHSWPSDVNGDGASDSTDSGLILGANGKYIHESGYLAKADIDRSGRVTQGDYALYSVKAALAEGQVGESGSGKADARVGFDGYMNNGESGLRLVRNRSFDPNIGRWLRRDPLGSYDGTNLLIYGRANPISLIDPTGLQAECGDCPEEERSTHAQCCEQFYQTHNSPGITLCCNGQLTTCVQPGLGIIPPYETEGWGSSSGWHFAWLLAYQCISAHEDSHVSDGLLRCKEPSPCGFSQAVWDPADEDILTHRHCQLYAAEVACYRAMLDLCALSGNPEDCSALLLAHINRVLEKMDESQCERYRGSSGGSP